jgi:hypothetical protein
MLNPIMEKHCFTERRRTPTKSSAYVSGQIDVRDTEWVLLNYLRASVFAASGINHLPFSGRSDHASRAPQTPTSGVVGRLNHLFRPPPHFLLLPLFCKLSVGYSTANTLSAISSILISHRLETYVSRASKVFEP